MNTKLVQLLGIVCALFLLLIVGEWFYLNNSQKKLIEKSSATKTEEYQPDEMPALDLSEQTEDNYADLVNRPLFIKGRRPVEEVPPETEQTPALAEVAFDWQLSGVYSSTKGLTALVSRTKTRVPKDNFRRLNVGADLDGWKLTIIEKDKVLLKQGDTEKPLLLRKIKEKQPVMSGQMPQTGFRTMPPPAVPAPMVVPEQQQTELPNAPIEPPQDPFETTTNE